MLTEPSRTRAEGYRHTPLMGALTQELHLVGAWIADRRHRSMQPREPWPHTPTTAPSTWPFLELTHLTSPGDPDRDRQVDLPAEAIAQAEDLGLLAPADHGHQPGRWQLTAMHDVLAVRDRPNNGPPAVFLGDDGTRLLDTVLAARPHGTVVDVGCGAGLATAGAARSADHVHGFDIVPACVDAARTSARLTGVAHKVTITHDDLFTFQPPGPIDCIIANLPGVPVPPGLTYLPAGNGGEDGLALTRHLLNRLPIWTDHGRNTPEEAPTLLMRLQSPGDDAGPFALHDLQELAIARRLDISVVTDSRINAAVRDSLTTKYAAQSNPLIPEAEIEQAVRAHSKRLGMTHYYSSSVTARPGDGRLRHLDLAIPDRLNTTIRVHLRDSPDLVRQAVGSYYSRLARLPMGFWELGRRSHVEAPAARIQQLLTLFNEGQTSAQAIQHVFADEFAANPTVALALYSTTGLLIETMLETAQLAGVR